VCLSVVSVCVCASLPVCLPLHCQLSLYLPGRTLRVDHMDNYTAPEKKKAARSEVDLAPKKFTAGHAYVEDGVLPELIRLRTATETQVSECLRRSLLSATSALS
jgi:hypothetical protein